jgi:hypothetical protein
MGTRVRHRQISDVERYVIVIKLLDLIFNLLPMFMCW